MRAHDKAWFIVGMFLLAVATSLLVALSRSPVVAIVLPLIFGLAGSAGGIYIATGDISSELGRQRLALIGQSLAVFCITLVVLLPILLWEDQTPVAKQATLPRVGSMPTANAIRLVELRARLRMLGASYAEQTVILDRAASSLASPPNTDTGSAAVNNPKSNANDDLAQAEKSDNAFISASPTTSAAPSPTNAAPPTPIALPSIMHPIRPNDLHFVPTGNSTSP
jgi:hypothetical protein